jgi:hypothetical protein
VKTLAKWLLKLYPRQWRIRYQDELTSVIEAHRVTLVTFVDLCIGIIHAYFTYPRAGLWKFRFAVAAIAADKRTSQPVWIRLSSCTTIMAFQWGARGCWMDKFPCYRRAYLHIPGSTVRKRSLGNLVLACALRQWSCNMQERIRDSYWSVDPCEKRKPARRCWRLWSDYFGPSPLVWRGLCSRGNLFDAIQCNQI